MTHPSTKEIALKLIENISSEGAIENDAVIELMSDDVVIEMIPGASEAYLPFNGVYRGHAGARTWLALLEEYLMVEHIDRTYVCEGEYCFAFGNGLFTYAGMKVPFSFSEVVKVQQGKVTWYKEWVDCTKIVEMVKGSQYPKSTTNS